MYKRLSLLSARYAHEASQVQIKFKLILINKFRDVDPEMVVDAVEEGIRKTGYNDFSLLSLSCSDYLSLPSVGLQVTFKLAHMM